MGTMIYTMPRMTTRLNLQADRPGVYEGISAHFSGDDKFVGWVEVQWARPTGTVLEGIVETLKALKLTMRNTPLDAAPADGACFFTGEPAVERVLIGRTY